MTKLRPDLQIIADNITPNSRILDIGCGNGELMAALRDMKNCHARGLEIEPANVARAVVKGLSVVQGDADTDLDAYPGKALDYVILSQTLQTIWEGTHNAHSLRQTPPSAATQGPKHVRSPQRGENTDDAGHHRARTRRIHTRYDRRANTFIAAINIAAICVWWIN